MSLKELVIAAPELCGVPIPRRASWVVEQVWKEEHDNHDSIFARHLLDEGNESGRLDPIFSWTRRATDQRKAAFIRRIAELAMYAHYLNVHGETRWARRVESLTALIQEDADAHPDVVALYSVADAAKGFWT